MITAPHSNRRGKTFVVPRFALLPPNCVRCGATAAKPWRKKFVWRSYFLYLLILIPALLKYVGDFNFMLPSGAMYLILALCTGKTMDLNLPVCGLHHKDQKRSAWLARIMLLAFAPVGIATGVYFSEILGWVTGGLLLLVSLIHVHDAALGISVARIDNDGGVFKGACNEFLNLLPADPEFRS